MRFQTVIELGGKTATGFEVPADVVTALDSGKKPKVSVTIGGHQYRSTVAVYGERFMLPLNAENRTRAGVAAGDEVSVDVELDTKPREVSIPVDVQRLLEADPAAKARFDRLSYSSQREYISSIETAKNADTRQRRIDKMFASLYAS